MRPVLALIPLIAFSVACDPHGDLPTEGPELEAARQRAGSEAEVWLDALEAFRQDWGRYPTGREGLRFLVVRPDPQEVPDWNGPYGNVPEQLLRDPWRRPYQFESTAQHIAVISGGPDRRIHTGDDVRRERAVSYYP